MTIVLACDPGLTGAIAVLDHTGLRSIQDLPTMLIPGIGPEALIKREIDVRALATLVRALVPPYESPICVIEHASIVGGKGSQAIVSLAATKSAVVTTLRLTLKVEVHRVSPKAWKRFYGLSSDKSAALVMARRLWPRSDALRRAKDHNRAEAALIARWAQRNLT